MYGDNEGRGGFRPQRGFVPVKVDDELDVTIEAVGEKGDGIAKKDGFVLFVPGVKEGDQVKVRVTKVLRKVGFADVVGSESAQAAGEAGEMDETSGVEEESAPVEDSEDFGEEEVEAPAKPEAEEPKEEETEEETPAEEPKKEETPAEPEEEKKEEDSDEEEKKDGGITVL